MKYTVGKIKEEDKGKINKVYFSQTPGLDPRELVFWTTNISSNTSSILLSKIQREYLNKNIGKDEMIVKI